jgi:hypothetical protein
MNKLRLIMLSFCVFAGSSAANTKLKPRGTNFRPGKPDLVTELHNVRKSLAHFIDTTSDTKLAQTLTDFSKILKTAEKNPTSITKKDVEHTFSVIEEITTKLDESRDEAGFSEDCGCQKDCCKELKKLLCQIRGIIEKCCKHLTKEIKEIKKLIHRKFPCAHSIKIDHVPYVITEPGKYCVTKDLVFDGTGAAITVAVSNVTLNFANHSLTLTDPGAIGILASGISEFVLQNDVIQTPVESNVATSVAIRLIDCKKVTIDGVFTLNTYFGIRATTSDDIRVVNSHFEHHRGIQEAPLVSNAAISSEACTNVVIEDCVFTDNDSLSDGGFNSQGIVFRNVPSTNTVCRNCRVSNCELFNTALILNNVEGVIIETSSIQSNETTINTNLVTIGSGIVDGVDFHANDVIFRDVTFTCLTGLPGFDGILVGRGNGITFENVIIDVNSPDLPELPYHPAALHIGIALQAEDPTSVVSNFVIRNSIIHNTPFRSIYSEPGNSGIVVDNCLITRGIDANIYFDDTEGSTVKNSEINQSQGFGIRLHTISTGSNNNAILSNVVSDNGNDGISVDTDSLANLVKNNDFFVNAGIGIHNVDVTDFTNSYYFNDACNNLGGDCLGINPASLVAPAGFIPVSNGMNICCNATDGL